jgi:hypothetical protein
MSHSRHIMSRVHILLTSNGAATAPPHHFPCFLTSLLGFAFAFSSLLLLTISFRQKHIHLCPTDSLIVYVAQKTSSPGAQAVVRLMSLLLPLMHAFSDRITPQRSSRACCQQSSRAAAMQYSTPPSYVDPSHAETASHLLCRHPEPLQKNS